MATGEFTRESTTWSYGTMRQHPHLKQRLLSLPVGGPGLACLGRGLWQSLMSLVENACLIVGDLVACAEAGLVCTPTPS
jgi:hypothetical protein